MHDEAAQIPSPPGEPPPGAAGPPGERQFPEPFGKYVLLREMARGGMGSLFLAAAGEHGGLWKLCVVKTLRADSHDMLRGLP